VKQARSLFRGIRHGYERVASGFESLVELLERRYTPLGRFRPGPFEGWDFLWQPAVLGFVAMCLILVGGSFSGSPFKLNMAGLWFFGEPTSSPNTPPGQTELLLSIVCTYGGLLLLMRVWLRLAEIVRNHPGATMKKLWQMFYLWSLPLIVAPPLFSRDVFSYAAQGEMTAHGLSPYLYGPFTLGAGPYVNPVDPLWGNAPAPYGPLFLWIDGGIDRLAHHNQLATVIGLRLLEVLAVMLMGYAVTLLAKALRRDPSEAFVLAILNPMLLLELVNGAHNDALMTALLVLAVALALRRRLVWAVVACASAAAVKAPAALGLAFIAWTWAGPSARWRERRRPIAIAAGVSAGVIGLWTLMAGFGFGWVQNLFSNGQVRSWAAPATGLGLLIHLVLAHYGIATNVTHVLTITRLTGMVIALSFSTYLFVSAQRRGWVRSLAMALLLVVLLGPVVQPWYLSWSIVLLAASYRGREHFWLLFLTIIGPVIGLPGGRQLLAGLSQANPLLIAGAVAVLGGVLLLPMGAWTQWSWPEWKAPD